MKHSLKIISEEVRRRAIEIIQNLPLDVIHEVKISEYKKDRSASQNALYWQWLTIIGNELGESKETMHERYKDGFLVQIFERDDPDYAEMIDTLRAVYGQGMKTQALALRKRIVALTSTTSANVKQMGEYMSEIEKQAASLGIRLPHPEDV